LQALESGNTGRPTVRGADRRAGLAKTKKRMPPCNGVDRGSKFALTRKCADVGVGARLRESLENSQRKKKQMSVAKQRVRLPTCKGQRAVSGYRKVYMRIGPNLFSVKTRAEERMPKTISDYRRLCTARGLRVLEPSEGKLSCSALRGAGGGNTALPTRQPLPDDIGCITVSTALMCASCLLNS